MTFPGGPIPKGPGNDDDDLRPNVIACAVVCFAISAAAVAARFYTRKVLVRTIGAEDWLALAALVLAIGSTGGTIWQAVAGKGRHSWVLEPEAFINQPKASWFTTIFYQNSLGCCKISILLLYIRILTYSYARIAAYILLAVVVIYHIFGFISTFTLCIPLAKFWNPALDGHCRLDAREMWALIVLHISTDFLIFLIPLPVVIRMTTSLSNKLMLLGVFLLGFFVCLISILRVIWIGQLFDSADISWDYVSITNWTTIELCTSIVCTCLIVMKPLAVKTQRAIRSRYRRSRGSRGSDPDATSSSDSSSHVDRPPTIGTRPSGFAQFRNMQMGGHTMDTREKDSAGVQAAHDDDDYAAAVREVAMPSPGMVKTKESMSDC
ncbi:hypothetical protein V8F33_012951 [Rhypophila sp. PSN 637]